MAAKTNTLKVTLPTDTTIQLVREFDAPRELVWKAMSDPELVAQWWGPHGTTLTVKEMDLRVGGRWSYISRDADGTEHPFKGEYREIAPPERIVQTWRYDVPPFDQFESVEAMTLTEQDGRTTMTTVVTHASKEARDGHVQSGMEAGAAQTFERLDALLETLA